MLDRKYKNTINSIFILVFKLTNYDFKVAISFWILLYSYF